MKVIETSLRGVFVIELDKYADDRGFFQEIWNHRRYGQMGLNLEFVQDNLSFSHNRVIRGLHFQNPSPQGKLISVLQGKILDVAVNIQIESQQFRNWFSIELSSENNTQLYVPPGFAHGFIVLSQSALVNYKYD